MASNPTCCPMKKLPKPLLKSLTLKMAAVRFAETMENPERLT
jgi:hypothetical protein